MDGEPWTGKVFPGNGGCLSSFFLAYVKGNLKGVCVCVSFLELVSPFGDWF